MTQRAARVPLDLGDLDGLGLQLCFLGAEGAIGYVLQLELSPGRWTTMEGEKGRLKTPKEREQGLGRDHLC